MSLVIVVLVDKYVFIEVLMDIITSDRGLYLNIDFFYF